MANNWYSNLLGNSPPADPSSFDYDTASQKVQRQRAAAQALQTMGLQSNQGQFIKSGDFMGYAGGNTVGSTLAHLAAAALSIPANQSADDSQKQLGLDSQSALTYALDPNNSQAAQRARATQTQAEADQADQRDIARMNNTVQGGDYIDPQAQQQEPATVQTSPVSMPSKSDITPMPMSPAVTHVAAKVLGTPKVGAPHAMTPPIAALGQGTAPMSVTGGPQSFGTGSNLSRTLAPPTNLPVGASGPLSPDDAAFAARMLSGAPTASTSGKPQKAPQASVAPSSTPALPPVPAPSQALPSPIPTASQQAPLIQPMPPQAPSLEDRARAVGIDPTVPRGASDPSLAQQVQEVEATTKQMASGAQPQTDSRSMVEQAGANAQPTMADQIAQLQAISRTGPMGQQLATAQMNNLFGSKVGRYKTTVMADPVNGGFVKVTEDSATGATSTDRIGSPNGTLVTGQTTDANGNRLNVHKDGSTSPMLDASGKPVVDSTVTARNDDQATKIGSAVQSNATAQAAIDTALQRNARILQLYNETGTGAVLGHLPNAFSPKRQELHALLAQDLFSETRNALAGAGDAGGAPKMAQSEFKYMRDNGGLSQTTDAQAAANLIASMNNQLLAQKQALQRYAETLKATAPGAAAPSVPGRGQTVNAGQWGFK